MHSHRQAAVTCSCYTASVNNSKRGLSACCVLHLCISLLTSISMAMSNFFDCRAPIAGRESVWSVDGELLANNHISAKVYRGLIDVFGRGIE